MSGSHACCLLSFGLYIAELPTCSNNLQTQREQHSLLRGLEGSSLRARYKSMELPPTKTRAYNNQRSCLKAITLLTWLFFEKWFVMLHPQSSDLSDVSY